MVSLLTSDAPGMNPLKATFARLLLGLLAALMLAVPTVGYGQEGSEDRGRRGGWGRSEDGGREGGRDRGRGRDRDRRRDDRDEEEKKEPAYVAPARSLSPANESMGFGKPKVAVEGRGFGASNGRQAAASSSATNANQTFADGYMKLNDKNQDGRLTKDELDAAKLAKYDKNGDGEVKHEEIVAVSSGSSTPMKNSNTTSSNQTRNQVAGELRSYRLATATEKLPEEGLPSWFNDRDRDHDGQVSMHEWSRSWNSSTVRDFTSKDADGDGIITVGEALESER